jgi:ATP-binding cassette subfamily B protein
MWPAIAGEIRGENPASTWKQESSSIRRPGLTGRAGGMRGRGRMDEGLIQDIERLLDEDVQEPLPEAAEAEARRLLPADERRLVSLYADITSEGEYGDRWLLATDRRVATLAMDNGEAHVELELPWSQVRRLRLRDFIGSGSLEADTDEKAVELLRFSRSRAGQFARAYHILRRLAADEDAKPEKARGRGPGGPQRALRCPNCGRALPAWSEVCPFCMERGKLFVRLLSYLEPYKALAITGFLLTLGLTVLNLLPAIITQRLIDNVLVPKYLPGLWPLLFTLLGIYVLVGIISVVRGYLLEWLGARVVFDMRVQVYDHLQLLSLGFFGRKQTGQIMSRVTNDIWRLQFFIAEGFQEILINILTVLMICVILFVYNARLAALTLLPIPLIALATYVFSRLIHTVYHKVWRRWASITAVLADAIPGIRVVKSFAQEQRESRRLRERSQSLFVQELRAARLWTTFFPAITLMTGFGFLVVFGYGGYQVIMDMMSLGTLVMFTQLMWQFYHPVQMLGMMTHRVQHALTSAERVFEVLDNPPEIADAPDSIKLPHVEGRVEFRDVTFSYEPGKPVLTDINFVAEPGDVIGLVGPSGAGKSTLVHLLGRFYEVEDGQILLDGHDVRELSLRFLRQQIGLVLQEPFLFHGTVSDNIAYGVPRAKAEEIVAAAKAANAHDFIVNLPQGYDTLVGERGQLLSGGERQRVSIARAVLKNPRILILDEATSSVDTETEMLIQQALDRLVSNRTTFAIAHRLSTLRKATKIIVMEHGRIIELGTHNELLDGTGLYSRLCKLQAELSKVRAW